MKLLLTSIILLTAFSTFAQRQNVYFLKNNGKYVNIRDSADYIRVVREPDSASVLYNVFEYYLNGENKLIGKSSAIDPTVLEGQCAGFYKSGVRQSITNYKKGLPVGDDYEFYPNGKPYLIKEYPDNNDRYNDINDNFLIKENYDSLGTAQVKNGNGYYRGYDEKFTYVGEEGPVKNGKRDGSWKGSDKRLKNTYIETYENGQLINGTAIYEDGITSTYTKSRGVPPQFKGGLESFYRYLGRSIEYPAEERDKNIQGRVVLTFIVEKDGKVNNVVVVKSVSPNLDAEALRVIKKSPPWIPGMQFGRPVKVSYNVPISFSLN